MADPGAGSYYVEALTDALSRRGVGALPDDRGGGRLGRLPAQRAPSMPRSPASRAAKEKAVAERRRVLVGTNNYPNLQERELDAAANARTGLAPGRAVRGDSAPHRASRGRDRPHVPRVLLLERGDLKMRKARAAFCLNFFGCAGFDIASPTRCRTPTSWSSAARTRTTSTSRARSAAGRRCRSSSPGYPKDQIDALTAAGVADFVHVRSNAVETLTAWQDRLRNLKRR